MTLQKNETAVNLTEKEKGVIAISLYERYLSFGRLQAWEYTTERKTEQDTIAKLLQQLGYNDLLTFAKDTLQRERHEQSVNELKEAGLYVAKEK